MNKKVALLFAGQGAQYPNMGKDLYDNFEYVRDMFLIANKIIGYRLEDIVFCENDLLNQTKYTQMAILVTSCCLYEVIKREFHLNVEVVSGFSLGEYSALYASGIYSFEEILKIVMIRANIMEEASLNNRGKMAAIIGMDETELNKICLNIGNCWIANYNSPNQLVISGLEESINKVVELIRDKYKKRAVVLNVSGAFHSPLMEEAANLYKNKINSYKGKLPIIPIIMNYNAEALKYSNLHNAMKLQIHYPVQFIKTIERIITDYNIDEFIEIGPGRVLSGLVKKISLEKPIFSLDNLEDIKKYKENI